MFGIIALLRHFLQQRIFHSIKSFTNFILQFLETISSNFIQISSEFLQNFQRFIKLSQKYPSIFRFLEIFPQMYPRFGLIFRELYVPKYHSSDALPAPEFFNVFLKRFQNSFGVFPKFFLISLKAF